MSWAAGQEERRGWRSRGGAWVRGSRRASEESLQSLPLGLVGLVTRVVSMGQYMVRSKVWGDVRSSTALNQILLNAAQSAASDEIVKREFHSGGSTAET